MARKGLVLGWVLASLAGCTSERDQLREHLQAQLAQDILTAQETPRVARMQSQGPAGPGASGLPGGPGPAQPVDFRPAETRSPMENFTRGPERFRVTVRARVNGKPIFDDDIYNAIRLDLEILKRKFNEPQLSEEQARLFNDALNKFIDDEIVYQEAIYKLQKYNPKALDKLKEFFNKDFDKKIQTVLEQRKWTEDRLKEQLKAEGLTLESWRRKEEKQFVAQEYMRSRIGTGLQNMVTHATIKEYFVQHPEEFKQIDKVKWQNIFIAVGPKHPTLENAMQFAEDLAEAWRKGEDFQRLLAFDDGDSSLRQGEGVGQRRGEIKPAEVEDYLFALKSGEVGPPVPIATGVHLVRVLEREYAGPGPFTDEVQKTIRRKLQNDLGRREERRVMQELKARAVYEIIP